MTELDSTQVIRRPAVNAQQAAGTSSIARLIGANLEPVACWRPARTAVGALRDSRSRRDRPERGATSR